MSDLPAAARQSVMPSPPTVAIDELHQNSEPENIVTDMHNSDSDSDTDTGTGTDSMLDTDSEAGSDSEAIKHTDSTTFPCLTEADSYSEASHPDSYKYTDSDKSTDTQARTEGDLVIHSVLECNCDVMVCQFNNEGTILAVGLCDGTIKVYSTDNGSLVKTLKDSEIILSPIPVTALQFFHSIRAHSLLLATYASGVVRCWYVWGQECIWSLNEVGESSGREEGQRQTLSMSISSSGEIAATGGSDSVVHLYDLHTQQRVLTCSASANKSIMDGHRFRIFAVNFHPEREREFISGGWDNSIQFWDTRQQHSVRMLLGPHVCGDSLQINPVTNQILSGSWRKDKALEIFDYDSCQKISEGPNDPHGQSRIYTCHWLDQDHILAGGSQSNMLRVIDHQTLLSVARLIGLPSAVFSSCICPGGRWMGLIAASSGKRIFLLKRGCLQK
ncbi:U5 small nuclear ribonucleoprotein 40 kDa protein-like isoform X2 [Anguilla anguilla]|nr:U5 small nuclear ribonucleoprotein 40 kDa protein-like isoform X2 [Anguilla anguilla]